MNLPSPAIVGRAIPEHRVIGASSLVRLAFTGGDILPVWANLVARVAADPGDAAALLDMAVMLQTAGQMENALAVQDRALAVSRRFTKTFGTGKGLRLLALMTAGSFMANTPIEFLLEGSDVTLTMLYVDARTASLGDVSGYDLIFMAVSESETSGPVLGNICRMLEGLPVPMLNNAPAAIAALSRDGVARSLAAEPSILAPAVHRVKRDAVPAGFPIVIRPTGSHAGHGLEKIDDAAALGRYLASHHEPQFFVSPFVDYRSADGFYRKQRVAIIDGVAYPSHMGVSQHWMVHYLNAGMSESAARRADEAGWMASFETDFAVRHAAAFATLHRRFGLDYFTIDCAEMPDGCLLLFEADVAMIVHDMDPEDLFPYKKPAMRKLFAAFQQSLIRRVAGGASG